MERVRIPFRVQFGWVIAVAFILISVEATNQFMGHSLNRFGIEPRSMSGLSGILLAPWLHGSWQHLFSNLPPLLIFAVLLMHHGIRRFWLVTITVVLVGGGLVWLFGRSSFHLGASGLVYGYFGFLLLAGVLSKEISLLLISIVVGVLYGGLVWGVLPLTPGVSFESHLFGFVVGAICSFRWGKVRF